MVLYDAFNHLLQLRRSSKETSPWNPDCLSLLHQGEVLPKLGFRGELHLSFAFAQRSVFLPLEPSGCLVVFMPEEGFHPGRHLYFSAFIVNKGIRKGSVEGDAVVIALAKNIAPESSGIDECSSLRSGRAAHHPPVARSRARHRCSRRRASRLGTAARRSPRRQRRAARETRASGQRPQGTPAPV